MWRIFPLLFMAGFAWSDAPAVPDEPHGPLTLRDALDRSLRQNPQLAPYTWDARIGEARVVQARLRPNPELSLELENILLGDGARRETRTYTVGAPLAAGFEREWQSSAGALSELEITLSLSQVIELGGKRAARIVAAQREREVVQWDYEIARVEVAGEVLSRFTQTLAAQERLRQEREVADLAKEFSATVEQLVQAGEVSPLESRRARAEAERAQIEIRVRERALEQARLRLSAMWGSTRPQFAEAVGALAETPALPPLETILALRESHPALKRWGAELARRDAVLAQQRAQRVPDLTLRAGYRATGVDEGGARSFGLGTDGISASRTGASGDDWQHGLVLEASVPLPLFHRNQGAIREAELAVQKLGDEQRAWEATVLAAVTEQHAVAEASLERLDGLDARVLPELEQTYELTQEGYRRGKFGFLAVLEAQRAVVDARLEAIDARIAYHLARAEMERILGAGFGFEPAGPANIDREEEPNE